MDVVLLSRIQFALTIMFHYLFPPLTIGMGLVLVFLQARSYWWNDTLAHRAAKFWTKIFGLHFALGVASGIVMEFQFGTNWATYSRFVGDVFGSALAAEGIFAFFLESGFLALLLFGWDRVSKGFHFFSTCMVALGSIFSSVWIVVANSWQQTPAGHHIVPILRDGKPWVIDGEPMMRAEIVDFWAMVFNPSSMIRLSHVLIGCFIMGAFFVMSVSAWYVLKGRHLEFAKRSFQSALIFGLIFSYLAAFSGHIQAKIVYKNQPAKLATVEGHFHTGKGDLIVAGIPSGERETVDYALKIPGGLSFLLFEDFNREVIGLDKFRPEDRPPLLIPFIMWRLMLGIGTLFIGMTTLATFYLWRGTLWRKRWLLWLFVVSVVGAVVANQAGWIMAEVGRQPWIVHPPVTWIDENRLLTGPAGVVEYAEGLGLRTTAGVSKAVAAEQVLASIILFAVIYILLLIVWIYTLHQKILHGPEEHADSDAPHRTHAAETIGAPVPEKWRT